MKNFAELDENNIVVNVIVTDDDFNQEGFVEYTSKKLAMIGFTYNKEADVFIGYKPACGHSELILDTTDYLWKCSNEEHNAKSLAQ